MEAFPSLTESGCKEFPFAVRPASRGKCPLQVMLLSPSLPLFPPRLRAKPVGRGREGGREEILPGGPSTTKATATRSMSTPLWLSLKYRFSPSSPLLRPNPTDGRQEQQVAHCEIRRRKGRVELLHYSRGNFCRPSDVFMTQSPSFQECHNRAAGSL